MIWHVLADIVLIARKSPVAGYDWPEGRKPASKYILQPLPFRSHLHQPRIIMTYFTDKRFAIPPQKAAFIPFGLLAGYALWNVVKLVTRPEVQRE